MINLCIHLFSSLSRWILDAILSGGVGTKLSIVIVKVLLLSMVPSVLHRFKCAVRQLNLSKLCQSDKSMTSFAPSLKIQVYDNHIVSKVVRKLSETRQKLVMFNFYHYT